MDKPLITLRSAQPSFEEGKAYARYLDVAAEGFFRFMLGRRAVEIIGKAYAQTGHNYSYEHVLFAEQDNRIVGMASGFTAEQHRTFSDQPLKQAAGSQAFRLMVVKTLLAPMMRILNTLAAGDFYLVSIATDNTLRGAGIGSALMDAMEERAVASGSVRLALDVSASNEGCSQALRAPWDDSRVTMAKAHSHTGTEILSDDQTTLSSEWTLIDWRHCIFPTLVALTH